MVARVPPLRGPARRRRAKENAGHFGRDDRDLKWRQEARSEESWGVVDLADRLRRRSLQVRIELRGETRREWKIENGIWKRGKGRRRKAAPTGGRLGMLELVRSKRDSSRCSE